ncbi:MAG: hypothetical protein PWP65_624 [Clostridia bacterium]|nr:hypothetical protein [Clostridia bacterium]
MVVATGAVPNNLNIHVPVGGPSVVQANDVIAGRVAVGQRVVVVGGRYVGMEVADLLAEEGKHVSLIEAVELGWGTILGLKAVLRNRLVEKGVYIYPHSPLMRITKTGVDVANNGAILHLKADTVVLAIGTRPVNHLLEEIKNLVPEAYAIGDCTEIGDAMEAINQGAEIGRLI